jgi:hypothetical protein
MTTAPIPDFTAAEQELVAQLLMRRYARPVEVQMADSELQLTRESVALTLCPTLYWCERGAQFAVCKTGAGRYRCQFFYSEATQYGTGRAEYDDLENCVMTLLQVQADHERQQSLASIPERAAAQAAGEYGGPVVV